MNSKKLRTLRLQLGDQVEVPRGGRFEEAGAVGILYLLRALCRPVPLTTVFDLQFVSSWEKQKYQIVARLGNDDVSGEKRSTEPGS